MDNHGKDMQEELQELLNIAKDHQSNMARAVESLNQMARGTISLIHFKDLKRALSGIPEARATLERAKRMVKAKLQEELKEG